MQLAGPYLCGLALVATFRFSFAKRPVDERRPYSQRHESGLERETGGILAELISPPPPACSDVIKRPLERPRPTQNADPTPPAGPAPSLVVI